MSPGEAIIGGLLNGLMLNIPEPPTAIIRSDDGELHEGTIE